MSTLPKPFPSMAATAVAITVICLATTPIALGFQAKAVGAGIGTIEIDGRTRTYFVHVPPNYDGTVSVPLVLLLHGGTQSVLSAERMSGMSRLADRENFILAYPTGTSRSGRTPTWNSGNCCGYALRNNIDDVAFLRALIDKLKGDYNVNPRQVYVSGISNGGMMAYRAACELADEIAAIAPVEGAQNVQCNPSFPVSVIVFHGTADRLVPFEGGTTPFQPGPRRSDTPLIDAVAFWVKLDGCSPIPKQEANREVQIDTYSGCKDGTGVTLYAIQGGHHMWPGTRISGNSVRATEIMWRFFAQHPKP